MITDLIEEVEVIPDGEMNTIYVHLHGDFIRTMEKYLADGGNILKLRIGYTELENFINQAEEILSYG